MLKAIGPRISQVGFTCLRPCALGACQQCCDDRVWGVSLQARGEQSPGCTLPPPEWPEGS